MYNPSKPYREEVLSLIKKTWNSPFIKIYSSTYSIIKKKVNYPEVDHTDGIGTKGIYHWQKKSFKNAVLDALAMNLNDLALVRAIPYKLQNHIILPWDNQKAILEIIKNLSRECQKRKIVITGGETSIQNTTQGMDLSLTVSGFIKNRRTNQFKIGDVLLGIKSSGLHSNGFTKIREIFRNQYRPEFIEPTKIYLEKILEIDRKVSINGMMHITGGAFTKLKPLLKNADIIIYRKLKPQKIFYDLYRNGVSDEEMYKTFNCGVGFIFSTTPQNIIKLLPDSEMDIIGKVIKGHGRIKIESSFSNKKLEY